MTSAESSNTLNLLLENPPLFLPARDFTRSWAPSRITFNCRNLSSLYLINTLCVGRECIILKIRGGPRTSKGIKSVYWVRQPTMTKMVSFPFSFAFCNITPNLTGGSIADVTRQKVLKFNTHCIGLNILLHTKLVTSKAPPSMYSASSNFLNFLPILFLLMVRATNQTLVNYYHSWRVGVGCSSPPITRSIHPHISLISLMPKY